MINKLVSTAVLAATVAAVALPAAAQAKHYDRDGYSQSRYDDDDDNDRYERRQYIHERRGYAYGNGYQPRSYQSQRYYQPRYDQRYDQQGRYAQTYQPNTYYGDRSYRGDNYYGQQTRRCSNGTTGTILGAIAGGLVGNGIAGRGDRTLGAVLGGGAGALAGRAIDRNGNRC